ncbi:MAG TPA: phage holin family protein [Symbiobacteriaceae bacterium]|nr:phage holin family protein [Symbiobacteriaceae bacterium]
MRLLVSWFLNAATLFGIAYFAPRLGILSGFSADAKGAVVAVAVLAILNLTVRPILKLLSLPITCLTFGLFTLVINALMMFLTGQLVTGFIVGGFWNALVLSVIYAVASAILNGIFNPKEDDD